MTDDPTKKNNGAIQPVGTGQKISIGSKSKFQPLWARDKAVSQQQEAKKEEKRHEAAMMENRIALLLDISGSMSGPEIEQLRKACEKFLDSTDLSTTSLAIETFPFGERYHDNENEAEDVTGRMGIRLGLTTDFNLLTLAIMGLRSMGSTPMHRALAHVHSNLPITRGVLISDGEADSPGDAIQEAEKYRESETSIDCIHIGHDSGGEQTLKRIAELTKGIFIKFKDVDSFAKALHYLSPKNRFALTSGAVSAEDIGASEIKYLGGK